MPHGEWENWIKNTTSGVVFSGAEQARRYMKLAKNKELAHVVNDTDSSFNLEDINKAIANASDAVVGS